MAYGQKASSCDPLRPFLLDLLTYHDNIDKAANFHLKFSTKLFNPKSRYQINSRAKLDDDKVILASCMSYRYEVSKFAKDDLLPTVKTLKLEL